MILVGCKDQPSTIYENRTLKSEAILEVANEINIDTLTTFVKELSGEVPILLNGNYQYIYTRYKESPDNNKAEDYLQNKFEKYNLIVENQNFSETGRYVIATQPVILHPEKKYIICAHYDIMPEEGRAPGADDNASGVAAVIEAARIISNIDCNYTISYILWDEEEQGVVGSTYYASLAQSSEEDIKGVIDMDMIGWDSDYDNKACILVHDVANSIALANKMKDMNIQCSIGINLVIIKPGRGSDSRSFWQHGFSAIGLAEDYFGDMNVHYHTSDDKIEHFNIAYFYRCTKAAITTLAHLAY